MPTYKFEEHDIEFTDPAIEFTELVKWDIATKIGAIKAVLTSGGAKYGVILRNVDLPTVNEGTINSKGNLALQQYEI